MKILAFTDIHGSLSALRRIGQKVKTQNPDLLVCAGDISLFERGLINILRKLNKFNKKIIIIHGNHEDDSLFAKHSKSFKNIIFLHKKHFTEQNVLFLGYGGGGFALVDREFEKFSAKFTDLIKRSLDKKIVLLTHAPPYRTRLDKISQSHCGNKSFRNFVEKNKINLMICGHLHENFGKEDKIGKTRVINPGPFGKVVEI